MIHPGLAALEKWEPVEYAAGCRAHLARYRIQRSHIVVDVVAGKTPIRSLGTNVSWPMSGKMIT
jgi:hypothetical protein